MHFRSVFVLFLLFSHVSARSFFADFRGAVSNVERGFGKLFSDVVFDVKDTLHCTLSAVEKVLYQNGLLDKSSDYDYRCRGISKTKPLPFNVKNDRRKTVIISDHEFTRRHINRDLQHSLVNIDRPINTLFVNHESARKLNYASNSFQDDTNRLIEISDLLRRELNRLSYNTRYTRKIDNTQKLVEDTVWEQINFLHDIQLKSKNTTEINEIRGILDDVVHKLNIDSDGQSINESDKFEEIRKRLQQYTSNRQKQHDISSEHQLTEEKYTVNLNITEKPKTLKLFTKKEVKKLISQDLGNILKKHDKKSIKDSDEESVFHSDSDPFANFGPKHDTDSKKDKMTDDTKTLIKDSLFGAKVMKKFFKKPHPNTDVFNESGVLDFGKH